MQVSVMKVTNYSIRRVMGFYHRHDFEVTSVYGGVATVTITDSESRRLLRTFCISPSDLDHGTLEVGYIHVKSSGKILPYGTHCNLPSATTL